MNISAKLIFLCGKMVAGKSTLARDLAQRENAVLLVQDEFLDRLFPGEIIDIPGFVKCSSRLKNALAPHVVLSCRRASPSSSTFLAIEKRSVPGSVKLLERANAEHELHFVEASDALCKSQLKERSKDSAGTPWTRMRSSKPSLCIFSLPSEDERFNVVRHERA
jgi:AAA domain-containing protein